MDIWYTLSLGDGVMAGTPSAEIQDLFQRSFSAAGSPPDMAVFTRPESEDDSIARSWRIFHRLPLM